MYLLLKDNTRINNVSPSSSPTEIVIIRDSYETAGAVRDLFNLSNSSVIRLYNENGTKADSAADLILLGGCELIVSQEGVLCKVSLRYKTTDEKLQDEIVELQDAIIDY